MILRIAKMRCAQSLSRAILLGLRSLSRRRMRAGPATVCASMDGLRDQRRRCLGQTKSTRLPWTRLVSTSRDDARGQHYITPVRSLTGGKGLAPQATIWRRTGLAWAA